MTSTDDIWATKDWPAGWSVAHVATTGSTNADLLAALDAGTAGARSVLVADHQSAGRGRLDRRWDAPAGTNLLVSIAIAPVPTPPATATQRIGLAAVAAARRFRPDARIGLKWPNDVMLDGAKLAGILAQRSSTVDAVVVGIGLNVGWAPDGAAALGAGSPADVLGELLAALDVLPDDIGDLYRRDLLTLGAAVRVELPDGTAVDGVASDVDEVGRLIVDTSDGVRVFDVGDIVHARRA